MISEEIIGTSYGGIFFSGVADGCIEKNIVNDCENGIKIKNQSSPMIKNNYINSCENGILVSWSSNPKISFNNIYDCLIGVYLKETCQPIIIKNSFRSEICIETWAIRTGNINSNYNNFNFSNKSIQIAAATYVDQYAENNYYYTIDEKEIENSIIIVHQSSIDVIFQPFLTEKYPYAGIQNE